MAVECRTNVVTYDFPYQKFKGLANKHTRKYIASLTTTERHSITLRGHSRDTPRNAHDDLLSENLPRGKHAHAPAVGKPFTAVHHGTSGNKFVLICSFETMKFAIVSYIYMA